LITEPVFPLLHFLPFQTRSSRLGWQARRVSNPQPAVLETAALPIELLAFFTYWVVRGFTPPDPSALQAGANASICLPGAPRAARHLLCRAGLLPRSTRRRFKAGANAPIC